MGYLCADFSLPRPLCSRLRPDVRDRQADVRHVSSLNSSALWGQGHNDIPALILRYVIIDAYSLNVDWYMYHE